MGDRVDATFLSDALYLGQSYQELVIKIIHGALLYLIADERPTFISRNNPPSLKLLLNHNKRYV